MPLESVHSSVDAIAWTCVYVCLLFEFWRCATFNRSITTLRSEICRMVFVCVYMCVNDEPQHIDDRCIDVFYMDRRIHNQVCVNVACDVHLCIQTFNALWNFFIVFVLFRRWNINFMYQIAYKHARIAQRWVIIIWLGLESELNCERNTDRNHYAYQIICGQCVIILLVFVLVMVHVLLAAHSVRPTGILFSFA